MGHGFNFLINFHNANAVTHLQQNSAVVSCVLETLWMNKVWKNLKEGFLMSLHHKQAVLKSIPLNSPTKFSTIYRPIGYA